MMRTSAYKNILDSIKRFFIRLGKIFSKVVSRIFRIRPKGEVFTVEEEVVVRPETPEGTTEIVIPEGETMIQRDAFSVVYTIEEGVLLRAEIPEGITEIVIPEGVTMIQSDSFRNCTGLRSVVFPQSLTEIGPYAFAHCSGLTGQLNLPLGVSKIGAHAFSNCNGLTGPLVLPPRLTEIGRRAFTGCTGFTHVFCPEELETIVSATGDDTLLAAIDRTKRVKRALEAGFSTLGGDEVALPPVIVRQYLLALQPLEDEKMVFASFAEHQPKVIGDITGGGFLVKCANGYYYPFYQGGICTLGVNEEGPCLLFFEEGMVSDKLDLIDYLLETIASAPGPKLEVINDILENLPTPMGEHKLRLEGFMKRIELARQGGSVVGADKERGAQIPSMFDPPGAAFSSGATTNTRKCPEVRGGDRKRERIS